MGRQPSVTLVIPIPGPTPSETSFTLTNPASIAAVLDLTPSIATASSIGSVSTRPPPVDAPALSNHFGGSDVQGLMPDVLQLGCSRGLTRNLPQETRVPLRIDEATVDLLRPSEARICIEVNLEHKLLDRIWIDRGSFWQPIVYERLPHFCTKCCHMCHIIDQCRMGNPSLDSIVTQATKPFVVLTCKPIVAPAPKPIVAPTPKPFVQATIVDSAREDKEKEVVDEAPRQWVLVVGSSSAQSSVVIPPFVVHVRPAHQLLPIILIVLASKPARPAVYDLLLDHMMSVPRETSSLSVPIIFSIPAHIPSPDQAIEPFDTNLHISPCLSCNENVETLISLDNDFFPIEVHQ
ncbi:Uncharacterized protein Adt_35941 [Abeliophyllum distichum]|uniref:Uncharacterized protein n=1 Tax=Abeliophyllum distichum TaxID=126358 RepID=A0ABD1QG54_9LAMI